MDAPAFDPTAFEAGVFGACAQPQARPGQPANHRARRPAILFAEDFDAPPGITVLDDPDRKSVV